MNRSDSTGLMDVPQQISAPSEAGGLEEVWREDMRNLLVMRYGCLLYTSDAADEVY